MSRIQVCMWKIGTLFYVLWLQWNVTQNILTLSKKFPWNKTYGFRILCRSIERFFLWRRKQMFPCILDHSIIADKTFISRQMKFFCKWGIHSVNGWELDEWLTVMSVVLSARIILGPCWAPFLSYLISEKDQKSYQDSKAKTQHPNGFFFPFHGVLITRSKKSLLYEPLQHPQSSETLRSAISTLRFDRIDM